MSTPISRTTGQAPPVTVIDLPGISPATIPLPELSPHQAIEAYVTARSSAAPAKRGEPLPVVARRALESCSDPERSLVANIELHPFIQAVHLAFAEHRPLVLSPDAIWLLVTQGFAAHVNANSQALRSQFVSHAGKIRLTVRRDDFVKGSSKNAWNEAIAEFIVHIRDHVKSETMDLLQPRFSTTTPTDVVASHIVLMDAFQSYFDYEVLTLCGIPQILLEGTVEDWEDLAMRARGLAQFDLALWMKYLVPILDEFASAAKGTIREPFWRSIYKIDEMSGGPYVTGWINGFFPYLLDRTSGQATERHPQMSGPVAAKAPVSISIRSVPASIPPAQARKPMSWIDRLIRWPQEVADQDDAWREQPAVTRSSLQQPQDRVPPPEPPESSPFGGRHGPPSNHFPHGLSIAPFNWHYRGTDVAMQFLAGFVGVHQQSETLRLRPQIGWAVRDISDLALSRLDS